MRSMKRRRRALPCDPIVAPVLRLADAFWVSEFFIMQRAGKAEAMTSFRVLRNVPGPSVRGLLSRISRPSRKPIRRAKVGTGTPIVILPSDQAEHRQKTVFRCDTDGQEEPPRRMILCALKAPGLECACCQPFPPARPCGPAHARGEGVLVPMLAAML